MADADCSSQPRDESKLREVRTAYVREVQTISLRVGELRSAGKTDEEIATEVHRLRREIGVKYKNLTPHQELQRLYRRNLDLYGNELGPTIDYLRNVQNKSWQQIIESGGRTSAEYNGRFGIE
ncbi:MAG TPA: hypothetical protein DDZ60_06070 [Planktothrix sp. UBA10369]|nr:hypothetical protein [Planktothrix sp. UBA10369]